MSTPLPHPTDTICALSTAPGLGGVAVVRVSGPQAIEVVSRRWLGKPIETMTTHTAHLGRVTDSDGSLLDEVVLTVFRAPGSYTGDDVVELSCHGSMWIEQQLVHTLIDAGCRMAEPGEFTRRAFAAGRLDLAQAEAVADVIAAQSRSAHQMAMSQMRGAFSREIEELRTRLLRFVSLIELELDFSEEDVTFAPRDQLSALADEILAAVSRLTRSFGTGDAIRNGLPVAIVGQTNAGKSTLLNALLGDERALVSDVHGTTRDTVDGTITLGGAMVRLIDTAGLRNSNDRIEAMGIERSIEQMLKARVVIWVVDANTPVDDATKFCEQVVGRCREKQLLLVVNKTDLAGPAPLVAALQPLLPPGTPVVAISAHDSGDVEHLRQVLSDVIALPSVGDDTVLVSNARHYQALLRAGEAMRRVADGLDNGLSGDLLSQDIREVLHHLGTITGQVTTHDILGEIFAKFCVGK